MKTLIELYDERPIENLLSADVFKPETVIYLCPTEAAQSKQIQGRIRSYLDKRHPGIQVVFLETSRYYTDKVERQLERIIDEYEDCAIDITGGSDNVLFAAGKVSASRNISVFTYSSTKNKFFNISNAEFADGIECVSLYKISDFIEMAGGKADVGRVNYDDLMSHLDYVGPLFEVFMKYRTKWNKIVSWMQKVSRDGGLDVTDVQLSADAGSGRRVFCPRSCLEDLYERGLILNLTLDDKASFSFPDKQIRFWLRDVGSALEVFTFKNMLDSGVFDEYKCSVIVEWEGHDSEKTIYNEVDVMALQGITPYFVSCKACKINTYALNELEILRDRFGGEGAEAVLVSSETCSNATRNRARALNIEIVDYNDIRRNLDNG